MAKKIPTLLIHGSLGSGKTTLIKNLLSSDYFAKAFIIENEFASENIDKQTLADHQDGNVFDIAGGCICCSSGKELEEALNFIIAKKWDRPVIIEATGVASSVQLLQKLFLNPVFLENFELISNIYVLDPLETGPRDLAAAKKLDARLADLVLINKIDLAAENTIKNFERILASTAPDTPVIKTIRAVIDIGLLQLGLSRTEEKIAENFAELKNYNLGVADITYTIYEPPQTLSKEMVENALRDFKNLPGISLKRAKGYFADAAGQWWHLEATRLHQTIEPALPKQKAVLVFIGEGINSEAVTETFSNSIKYV